MTTAETLTRTAGARTIPAAAPPTTPTGSRRDEVVLQEAHRLCEALGRWYVEAIAGRRDPRQVRGLLTPVAEQRVCTTVLRATTGSRGIEGAASTMPVTRHVSVRRTGDHYEGVAIIDTGHRTTAVACAMHRTPAGWRVSDLARPEDQLPALAPPVIR